MSLSLHTTPGGTGKDAEAWALSKVALATRTSNSSPHPSSPGPALPGVNGVPGQSASAHPRGGESIQSLCPAAPPCPPEAQELFVFLTGLTKPPEQRRLPSRSRAGERGFV